MPGEINLKKLLRSMKPRLNAGEYVFCAVRTLQRAIELDPLCMFQEEEAVTVILSKGRADQALLPYSSVLSWITLTVHSSLEAVGLTSAVSKALTEANISCNMVAAYYHDHIFVPASTAQLAMDVLMNLTKQDQS